MKAATTLITLFVALAAASVVPRNSKGDKHNDGPKLPYCAKKCIHKFWKYGHCKSDHDVECLCTSRPFHNAVGPCFQDNCDDKEITELRSFISETCGQTTWGYEEEPVSKPVSKPEYKPAPETQDNGQSGYGY
ncbi:hypothetical protein F5X99DRAFT_426517 [Biscogniauxia marginata]|nr:hypothetical protein F5X99DRAFT_426517 [Biscogniauxia marginata]